MFHFCPFVASADRCIQNIYKKLHQDAGTPKKYPGVLASLLMLDKLSIEDIKASVTELMAGGVDTVRRKKNLSMRNCVTVIQIFKAASGCVTDFYNASVDVV